LDSGKAQSAGKEMLKQLARTDPYYKRNRPKVCSFFVKGECTRGTECPYRYAPLHCVALKEFQPIHRRHEKPEDDELSKQNIQDRYYGRNDPVARKILSANAENLGLKPPDDTSIVRHISYPPSHMHLTHETLQTSIFLSSLSPDSTETSIRTRVIKSLSKIDPAQVRSIVHVAKSRFASRFLVSQTALTFSPQFYRCAFVNFKDRATAERAAEAWANGLDVDGERVSIRWGRSKAAMPPSNLAGDAGASPVVSS
jgi:pre-mRNA-splicing factor RBM22/SLT11